MNPGQGESAEPERITWNPLLAERWPKRMWGRAIAVWLLVMAVEFVQGLLRWIFLRPRVGDFRSGQIGVFTRGVWFLLMVCFCEPWMKLPSFAVGLRAGLLGVALTLVFAWIFGTT